MGVITTILRGEPFLSLKPDHASLSGKDKYEGFLLDLVTALADKLGFDFSMAFMHVGITALYKNNGHPVSLQDLLDNPSINLGVFCCGSSGEFFKRSGVPLYQPLYQKMLSDPAGLPDSNAEGVDRVKEGGYAYFLESPSAEFHASKSCDLTTVGGKLDSKGYGIVLPQGSPY